MTVESEKNKSGPFNVTGTSGTFPRDFLLLAEADLRVIRIRAAVETDLTTGIGHTGIGTTDGTVVISTGIAAGDQIYLLRAVPNLQRSDYNSQGRVHTEQVEVDFDRATMQIQDLAERQSRSLMVPVSSELTGEEAMQAVLDAPRYAGQAMTSAAQAAADAARAREDADRIAEWGPAILPSRAALLASDDSYAAGSVMMVRREAVSYQVAPASATDHHMTTAGGVKLYELGPKFTTRARLGQAVQRGALAQGAEVSVQDVEYTVDATATGMASAMWDIGANGVRSDDRPQNGYLAAFHDLNNPRIIRLHSSADGRAFRQLNDLPLQYNEAFNKADVTGGNPVIVWRDGWFYMLVQLTSVGVFDFVIYKTRDFTSLQRFNCTAGPAAVSSATVPAPGASVPCDEVWGADMALSPDGTLDVWITVPFGPSITDAYGFVVGDRRVYRTRCTDLAAMTFSAPTVLAETPQHPPRVYQSTTGAIVAPTLPLNHLLTRQAGDVGFDLSFSEFFTSAFPLDNLIFVPCAYGGAGFANGHWNAGNATYLAAVARINAVIAANPGAVVEGVLWHQGEADKGNVNYQANLTSFISRLRTDVPQLAGKPFIMGEVAVPGNGAGVTDPNAVMAAIAATVANTGLVSQTGLVTQGDNLHFAPNSYRALGMRYWKEFKRVRGSVGSGATGVDRIIIPIGQSNAVGWRPAVTPSMIDASVTRTPEGWFYSVKDEVLKAIRIYAGPGPAGPWTFREVVYDDDYKIEGSSIVPRRTGGSTVVYDLFFEGHDDTSNVRSTRMMVRRSAGASPTGWRDREFLKSTRSIRHGTPLNLGYEDPQAYQAFSRVTAAFSGEGVATVGTEIQLAAGVQSIRPQQDVIYFVTGSDLANLTILDGAGDRFWLACLSGLAAAGIYVRPGGEAPDGGAIGFGINNNRMVEFTRRANGKYFATDHLPRAAFKAHKNGVAQTVSVNTDVAVGFSTPSLNVGGFFGFGVFRPPAGVYRISVGLLLNSVGDGTNTLKLMRNGAAERQVLTTSRTGSSASIQLEAIIAADAGDEFTVVAALAGSGTRTIAGGDVNSWFEAVAL